MRCPECHGPMQNGYIPTGGGIMWFGVGDDPDRISFARGLPGTSSSFRRAKLEAYRCVKCKLVTFRYDQQVEDVRDFVHR